MGDGVDNREPREICERLDALPSFVYFAWFAVDTSFSRLWALAALRSFHPHVVQGVAAQSDSVRLSQTNFSMFFEMNDL
jgi:hypothetical protein